MEHYPKTQQNPLIPAMAAMLKAAVTGKREPLLVQPDMERVAKLAAAHGISSIIYTGAALCGVDANSEPMTALFRRYCAELLGSQRQMQQLHAVFTAFDDAGVDYLPLKGSILKDLYPQPEFRTMGDADILIRMEQYPAAQDQLLKLGYQSIRETDHELVWQNAALCLELHKRLIPSYNQAYNQYFENGWQIAKHSGQGTRYVMSDEDHFIYLITHFAKHYRDGGIGIRHLMDIWIYRRSKTQMDEAYIRSELKKIGIASFYDNILETIAVWFENVPSSQKTDLISQYILDSGSWGEKERHMVSAYVKAGIGKTELGNKVRWMLRKAFPSHRKLQLHYPWLKNAPALLPFCWLLWWFKTLFRRRDSIKRQIDAMKISSDQIDSFHEHLLSVGLNFEDK